MRQQVAHLAGGSPAEAEPRREKVERALCSREGVVVVYYADGDCGVHIMVTQHLWTQILY